MHVHHQYMHIDIYAWTLFVWGEAISPQVKIQSQLQYNHKSTQGGGGA